MTDERSEALVETELQRLDKFKSLRILDYFGRFEDITKFLRIFLVILFVISVTGVIGTFYFYSKASSATAEILAQSRITRAYLAQQELQNVQTFAQRLVTDYFSMSNFNVKEIRSRLAVYADRANPQVLSEIDELTEVITKGAVVQNLESMDYTKIQISDATQPNDTKQRWFVQIPVRVRVSKSGSDRSQTYDAVFGAYLVKSEKSLSNSFGLQVSSMGKIQEQQ